MENIDYEKIGNLKFKCNDLNRRISIEEYFKTLLKTLWKENEGFSGKRPFGNSGWEEDIYKCLVKHNVIEGSIGRDGYVYDMDYETANEFVLDYIDNM